MSEPTPMMSQYIEIKAANPDSLLFYRMGDFYELFFDDAETASRALGITLTKRGKYQDEDVPMCGVPVHSADEYLQKLIALGYRVAICEQTEDPAETKKRGAKAVVKRDVVRLVTPGTITEESLLKPGEANLLVALARVRGDTKNEEDKYAIAAVDISTGTFFVVETDVQKLSADLARLAPREMILSQTLHEAREIRNIIDEADFAVQPQPDAFFDSSRAEQKIREFFGVATLDGFGEFKRAEQAAAGAIIAYIEKTQIDERPTLSQPSREQTGDIVYIDSATRANLELTQTMFGEQTGSLLWAVDRTISGTGKRLLAERLVSPSNNVNAINQRLDEVTFFVTESVTREAVRIALKGSADMLRAASRLSLNRGGPRDMATILLGLETAAITHDYLGQIKKQMPQNTQTDTKIIGDRPEDLINEYMKALADELPHYTRDGGFIRDGYDTNLDQQRQLSNESKKIIAGLQSTYAQQTGIKNLKIRHNNMLGYFIEVTAQNAGTLQQNPETFIHRQTMSNAMRFSTTELAELESKIATAADKALQIELNHFDNLLQLVHKNIDKLRAISNALARIDVATSLAELAEEQGYARPIVDDSLMFNVTAGRHPVVEQVLRKQGNTEQAPFVANNCDIGGEDGKIWLLTGPNMGGKSTFLRQNAIIALMAQIGSFVPAGAAHIGVINRLFSRVGAADDLARGRSTFMVEMVETAAILNQADDKALVILDEIGRGTATFDGLSIAWATIEHIHAVNKCRTLFATHYHELTALSAKLDRVANMTLAVKEWENDVVFLHEVKKGTADRSYGIQVARLAGLPQSVVDRAHAVLEQLESDVRANPPSTVIDNLPLFEAPEPTTARSVATPKNSSAPPEPSEADKALADINPDELTPREALETLYRLRQLMRN